MSDERRWRLGETSSWRALQFTAEVLILLESVQSTRRWQWEMYSIDRSAAVIGEMAARDVFTVKTMHKEECVWFK